MRTVTSSVLSGPGIVVEESDVEQLREYFSTVVVERILEPPRMPLPQRWRRSTWGRAGVVLELLAHCVRSYACDG